MSRIRRIICVGSRFDRNDSAGLRVYDQLLRRDIPQGVEVIDGGLAGLDLLPLVEEAERVVFVDAVSGLAATSGVCILERKEAAECAHASYGHAADDGLTWSAPVDISADVVPTIEAAAAACLAEIQTRRHNGAISKTYRAGALL